MTNTTYPEDIIQDELYFEFGQPYYIISGIELDVEFDYLNQEEKQQAVEELENMIEKQGLEPITGKSIIRPDDVIYTPHNQNIEYAESCLAWMNEALAYEQNE